MSENQLHRARALGRPGREAMLRRDPSAQQFWIDNRELLSAAWNEWEATEAADITRPDDSAIDPDLRNAVALAWGEPAKESAVQRLLHEEAPGVFSFQLFDPDRLASLREYLDAVWESGIPVRPPCGIVLNRRGAMLDPRSEGYLGAPGFQDFYRLLIDTYMRPISRLVFPEVMGYDAQSFGFSIGYEPNTDTSIRPHFDASAATLNINLNVPGEEYTGSTVDFLDQGTGAVNTLRFAPGMAVIHRGHIPHTAHPIESGSRTNFVLWLFGDGGRMPAPGGGLNNASAEDRWTVPTAVQDQYAPF